MLQLSLHGVCIFTSASTGVVTWQDNGEYPVPKDDVIVKEFDLKLFQGKWYISAGLNPLFDLFDCQVRPMTSSLQGPQASGRPHERRDDHDGLDG